jgi:hypothetical protein
MHEPGTENHEPKKKNPRKFGKQQYFVPTVSAFSPLLRWKDPKEGTMATTSFTQLDV